MDDNQTNTRPKQALLFNIQSAVISSWDETPEISICIRLGLGL